MHNDRKHSNDNLPRQASHHVGIGSHPTHASPRQSSDKGKLKKTDQEKGTNIQVVLRCRGRNAQEIASNSPIIVEPLTKRRGNVLLRTTNKVYNFDRVFDQDATQTQVYAEVAQPILDQVLLGYNCTIFAYGQTGTGKTYTMEGDLAERHGKPTSHAGIIPRAIHALFETLDADQSEYSVKVSLCELYNEELRDLLSPSNDQRTLRIFEDPSGSGVIVQGIEETIIANATEAIRVMEAGSKNRSTAATRCNEKSSRSHCIFTLTVHIKETVPGGEEVLKVGKLNLVDLAGSENINRSGAEQVRAREAGMINQSLLTLGRVINQLVERSPHVPYRESKLTRLLKDSLGGRTKTCIIATVSMAKMNQEEIVSTLDYASRAKNICNRPEANQRMNPRVLFREYETLIERLKQDLQATRAQKGVYLSQQTYDLMTDESQSAKDRVGELTKDVEKLYGTLQEHVKTLEEKTALLSHAQSTLSLATEKLRSLDRTLAGRISEYQNQAAELLNEDKEHAEIEELVCSLGTNADIMDSMLRSNVAARKLFEDKISRLRAKLVETAHRKRQRAESNASFFFGAFESDLDEFSKQIRQIEEHFVRTYRAHITDERTFLQEQCTAVTNIQGEANKVFHEQRERLEQQHAMIKHFAEAELAKEEKAAHSLIGAVTNMINQWSKSRSQRLEDMMHRMDHEVDTLQNIPSTLDDMVEKALAHNDTRHEHVKLAEHRVSKVQDPIQEVYKHMDEMRSNGKSYQEKLLYTLQSSQAFVEEAALQMEPDKQQQEQQQQQVERKEQPETTLGSERGIKEEPLFSEQQPTPPVSLLHDRTNTSISLSESFSTPESKRKDSPAVVDDENENGIGVRHNKKLKY